VLQQEGVGFVAQQADREQGSLARRTAAAAPCMQKVAGAQDKIAAAVLIQETAWEMQL